METGTYYSAFKCDRWVARYKRLKITTLAYFDGCGPNARSVGVSYLMAVTCNWSVVICSATNIVHSYGCCKDFMAFIFKSL
jgi:hypothetical protein